MVYDFLKTLTRTVWILSFVSLFTDMASEMLYPIMPIYLKSIGFSVLLIGVLEGIAEAVTGLTKGYFGRLSDQTLQRAKFVQFGYLLSAVSKPLMALFRQPLWVLGARSLDRLGKGVRTAARDAILSDEATPQTKGKVFGFHRSMDTTGAVLGPLFALIFLVFYPQQYTILFFLAFIPGMLSVGASLLLRDKKIPKPLNSKPKVSFFDFMSYWKEGGLAYRKLLIGLLFFTLLNSSDIFLLLKLKDSGLSDSFAIGAYIFYNLIYALLAFPIGTAADSLGLKPTYILGISMFVIVYLGMTFVDSLPGFLVLFFLYGVYAAATEGISKAWITNICNKSDTATAIGTFASFQSICTMLASSLTGLIWYIFGAMWAFGLSAVMASLVVFYFIFFIEKPENSTAI